MTKQASERLETAQNRLEEDQRELAEIEQEVTEQLQKIADGWDAKAANIVAIRVPVEKTDIRVDELALVWIATA